MFRPVIRWWISRSLDLDRSLPHWLMKYIEHDPELNRFFYRAHELQKRMRTEIPEELAAIRPALPTHHHGISTRDGHRTQRYLPTAIAAGVGLLAVAGGLWWGGWGRIQTHASTSRRSAVVTEAPRLTSHDFRLFAKQWSISQRQLTRVFPPKPSLSEFWKLSWRRSSKSTGPWPSKSRLGDVWRNLHGRWDIGPQAFEAEIQRGVHFFVDYLPHRTWQRFNLSTGETQVPPGGASNSNSLHKSSGIQPSSVQPRCRLYAAIRA